MLGYSIPIISKDVIGNYLFIKFPGVSNLYYKDI